MTAREVTEAVAREMDRHFHGEDDEGHSDCLDCLSAINRIIAAYDDWKDREREDAA